MSKVQDAENWSIKISEKGSPSDKNWQNETLKLKDGCIQYLIHDFGEVVANFFGDDKDDNEYEACYSINKDDSVRFLEELGVRGFAECDATPIIKNRIKNYSDFAAICKQLGICPNFVSWR